MDRYFDKFPNVYYNGVLCKDITRRVRVNASEEAQGDPNIYYPFELKQNLRPDQVSEFYYEDSRLDWLVFLTNNVIDPYYQWYLDDRLLTQLVIDKYGSVEYATRKIKYYQNNWASDDQVLSVSAYNNTIEQKLKKYYKPNWGPKQQLVSFSRRQEDTTYNTNRIYSYTVNSTAGFIVGEPVDFAVVQSTIGQGEVFYSNATHLQIGNLSGNVYSNSTYSLVISGTVSNSVCSTNNSTMIINNIDIDEQVYYDPVSYYDYEQIVNNNRKHINLIAAGPHGIVVQNVADRLQENVDPLTQLTKEQ
jgi:hypothetical protein